MLEQPKSEKSESEANLGWAMVEDHARDNQENELEAEQESAAAMDADVPHDDDTSLGRHPS